MVARRRMRKGAKKGPRRGPKGIARKRGGRKNLLTNSGQYAIIRETIEFKDLQPNTGYTANFSLNQFDRASALAPNFKWYKAKSVEWILEPLFNTFQDTTGASSAPYLYEVMNRTQDSNGITLQDMQAMGCKPKKLTSKHVTKYTPNWCSPGLLTYNVDYGAPGTAALQQGLRPQYAYLASPDDVASAGGPVVMIPGTNTAQQAAPVLTNMTLYNGHTVWIDQLVDANVAAVARLTCNVVWEFKDPNYTVPVAYQNVEPKVV